MDFNQWVASLTILAIAAFFVVGHVWKPRLRTPLLEGEQLLRQTGAKLERGLLGGPNGTLYLTSKRLIFEALYRRSETVAFPLETLNLRARHFWVLGLVPLIPRVIEVTDDSGRSFRFALGIHNRNEWIHAILEQMRVMGRRYSLPHVAKPAQVVPIIQDDR